jgi:orotidine 5'-phosphate decarboxylase subfamily 2
VIPTYLERLAIRSASVGSVLCLGLDPDPGSLPEGFPPDVTGVERFALLIVEAAGPYAAAIKPNLAFYESLGAAGMAALERIRARIPSGIPVVMDAKRADIGTTAAHHAVALFDRLGADAVTVNP